MILTDYRKDGARPGCRLPKGIQGEAVVTTSVQVSAGGKDVAVLIQHGDVSICQHLTPEDGMYLAGAIRAGAEEARERANSAAG
jgi:hypothetical protein